MRRNPKLPETSETSIAITFLVVNLSQLLRQLLLPFLSLSINSKTNELKNQRDIIKSYIGNIFMTVKLIHDKEIDRGLVA